QHVYRVHFKADARPPVDAQWSLVVLDGGHDAHVHSTICSRRELAANADGSLDVYIQSAGAFAPERGNVLRAPRGAFHLALELMSPREEALAGIWKAPLILQQPRRPLTTRARRLAQNTQAGSAP